MRVFTLWQNGCVQQIAANRLSTTLPTGLASRQHGSGSGIPWQNDSDQWLAATGLSTPLGLVASPLHRVVLARNDCPYGLSVITLWGADGFRRLEQSVLFRPFVLRGVKLRRVDPHSLQFSEPLFTIETRCDFVCGRVDHEKPRGVIGVRRRTFFRLNSPENVVPGVAELGDVRSGNTLPALGGWLHETCLGAAREENRVPIRQRFALAAANKKNHHPNEQWEVSLPAPRDRHRSPSFWCGHDHRQNVGDQRLATARLATAQDSIASPLHRLVRHCMG